MFDTKRLTLAAFLSMIVAGSGSGQTCAAFLPASDTSISSLKTNFATADFNQDGKLDIASASLFQVDILLNTTPLRATTASFSVTTIPLATEVNGRGIAVFDANRDGKPDIVVADMGAAVLHVWLNTTPVGANTASFSGPTDIPMAVTSFSIAAADFNADGSPDLAVTTSAGIVVLPNITPAFGSTPSFGSPVILSGVAANGLVAADFNGDNRIDLAAALTGPGVSILLNTVPAAGATPSFAAAVTFASSATIGHPGIAPVIAAADFNRDGRVDLLVGGIPASVLLNSTPPLASTPSFGAPTPFATPGGFVAAGDFNGDGRPDALVVPSSTGIPTQLQIFPDTSVGPPATGASFGPAVPITTVDTSSTFYFPGTAVGDFNGDGFADIVVHTFSQATTISAVTVFLSAGAPLLPGQTLVRVDSAANPAITGQPLTLTASILNNATCGPVTGTVQFFDGGNPLGAPAGISASAITNVSTGTLTTSSLSQGIHFITASYLPPSAGSFYPGATSPALAQVVNASSCAPNITGSLNILPGGFRLDRASNQFVQTVNITNTGGAPIAGPVSLIARNLSTNATMINPGGRTGCFLPAGQQYMDAGVCTGGVLAPGQSTSVTLRFSDPSLAPITYTPAVVAGPLPR